MATPNNIYEYIKQQENDYDTEEVQVGENWYWNMRKHIQMLFHLINGKFFNGENEFVRALKNIMKPMVNLANWTEDLEVKDVTFFIEDYPELSFLIKKYHDEVYTSKYDLDLMFDEITESDNEFGGVLVKKSKGRPEVIHLTKVAFADQTDLMGGPIGFKYNFSPSKLRGMSKYGWGKEENGANISLNELVTLADYTKETEGTQTNYKNNVSGKNIEVYIVYGDMPNHYLYDDDDMENYTNQLHIVAFYTNPKGNKEGVCLYRKETDGQLKFFSSKLIPNRALGESVAEDMLHPQVWTNFLAIHKMKLLEASAKVPLATDDMSFATRNSKNLNEVENLEVLTLEKGTSIGPALAVPVNNIQLYKDAINEWHEQAQTLGSAYDPILGKEQSSGTTFRGQERSVAQGRGLHDRKRGKRAKFIEEIYRDWIIPDIVKEIVKGDKFLATLTTEDLTWISERIVTNKLNEKIKENLLKGIIMTEEEQENFKKTFKDNFLKRGNKKVFEILEDEFKDIAIKVGINIAGKQKNLADLSDKLLSIFQFVFQNPQAFRQAMQIPALAKSFSDILEFSGLSVGDFSSLMTPVETQTLEAPTEQGGGEGLDEILQRQQEQLV